MNDDQARRIQTASNIALIVAGVAAICWGLYVAQSVLAPTVLALVFGVVLSPLSDFWERLGLMRGLSALLSLVLSLFLIVLIAGLALPVAERLITAWPTILEETRGFVYQFQAMLQGLEAAGEEMREAVAGAEQQAAETASEDAASGGAAFALPSTADALFLAPSVLGQSITFVGVLFFFLLTRNEVYAWIATHVAPDDAEKETARRLKHAEREVARYFLTISVVNLGFGICTVIAMTILGVPSPLLWGVAVAVLNFVLYLGPAIIFVALLLTGLVVFDGWFVIVPALTFLGLNMIEAQFVTPTAIGRTMKVNPLLVFFALVFFLWLWGPVGGFVAIPMLLWALSLSQEITATRKELRREIEPDRK
ncbi:AI-2E family transporter [Palleronia abyssalis]|uniref:AI-2 transport protein TqsA n=1 Tax=Palleronia abyssalis TaxID=1501240 RepID=A0A2R8BQ66_9RHOB|nr:AI-2E family transporter [Palleronia abyssalis]SPJ22323.1 hypothetical protein PAA8504_00113 [Palleronia abyssalis]